MHKQTPFQIFSDSLPLLRLAWAEVSSEPFCPDMDMIKALLDRGILITHKADCGWYAYIITKHPFTSKVRAEVLSVYVLPEFRKSTKSTRLLLHLMHDARARGAQSLYFAVPAESPQLGSWTYNLGAPIDFVFQRRL